jgi:photosystem II stability/assembly factor-like uncharacterized protein
VLLAATPLGSRVHALDVTFVDINPDQSSGDAAAAWGRASGGRVNGLAIDPNNPQVRYAASEWGGLYKSVDGGLTWQHLDGHVPTATWDVAVDPSNSNRVYATSHYDGRVDSIAGISVSTDGGQTWTHPASATPDADACADAVRSREPSAFGIAIDPDDPQNVYIGTNCGLAVSTNSGVSWDFVDPTPPAPGVRTGRTVWDVVVHHGGIIDLCGDDGFRRLPAGQTTWTGATSVVRPSWGYCSLAVSPDEPYVVFVVAGTTIYESRDGGATWFNAYANPKAQGRNTFVAVNDRGGDAFDLWFGDVTLYRGACSTPAAPAPGGSRRCQLSNTWWSMSPVTAHNDAGVIVFDPRAETNACPLLYSNDGGVYYETQGTSPACHSPIWEQPRRTPHALWLWDLAGAAIPGLTDGYLYMGAQDNGAFVTDDAPVARPVWLNPSYGDYFDISASTSHVVFTRLAPWIFSVADHDWSNAAAITRPPGDLIGFQQLDTIDAFGPDDYVIVTSSGVYVTFDVTASPVVWTQLGASTTPTGACAVLASVRAGTPSFFVKAGGCNGDRPGSLWRFDGTGGGSWQQISRNGVSQFGVYDVDPTRPNRIFASDLAGGQVAMVQSTTGGSSWQPLPMLDRLMTGDGVFRATNRIGPTDWKRFDGYPQPTLVALDPADPDILVAGGADSGVFVSTDGGRIWELATDPLTPGISGVPHLPRPRHAYFDHETGNRQTVDVYVGTQGRGVWRMTVRKFEPRFEYAAKLVCGMQEEADSLRLARGLYASAINIRNAAGAAAEVDMTLALTYPPEDLVPGRILPIARQRVQADEALEVDCEDVETEVFPDGFPAPYIKGFAVIASEVSLDVSAVYTTADLGSGEGSERLIRHSSIDVEQIAERALGPVLPADLAPVDKGSPEPSPYCVLRETGQGTVLVVTIRNQGSGVAGPSTTEVDFRRDGASYARLSQPTGGLVAGQETEMQLLLPRGWLTEGENRFTITADRSMAVAETDETNNVGNGSCLSLE